MTVDELTKIERGHVTICGLLSAMAECYDNLSVEYAELSKLVNDGSEVDNADSAAESLTKMAQLYKQSRVVQIEEIMGFFPRIDELKEFMEQHTLTCLWMQHSE